MVMPILPVALEAGDVGRDAIGKPQLSVFNQLHHRGRRGDDLGERGEIEDRVERHRLDRRPESTVPHRLAVHHAIADSRDDHRAWEAGDRQSPASPAARSASGGQKRGRVRRVR